MHKRALAVLALLVGSLLIMPVTTASAAGWGGSDNPDWNNTATGVNNAHRCAGWTNRTFSGSLVGQDGLAVNATIGFNLRDAHGNNIDLATGCAVSGYGAIVQLNHYISWSGAKIGSVQRDSKGAAQGAVSANWVLSHLPANVTNIWIETYVRSYTGSPCGMRCAGTGNVTKYGRTNRREVKIAFPQAVVHLTAPTTPAYGGQTGSIMVRLVNRLNQPMNYNTCNGTTVTRSCVQVNAWSTYTPEGHVTEGWGSGGKVAAATWKVLSLASNQGYKARFDYIGSTGRLVGRYEGYTKVFYNYTIHLTVRVP
ncbi:MAG: hypothetical protein ACR2P2_15380 [Nakamurella sp.]